MKVVSRFEGRLLRLLHFFFGRLPRDEGLRLLAPPRAKGPPPTEAGRAEIRLSRTAVELIQDTLARGCVELLAREGWRCERFLRQKQVVVGRWWQRRPLHEQGLVFSGHSLRLLIGLTAASFRPDATEAGTAPGVRLHEEGEFTVGDQFLFYLAYRAVRPGGVAEWLRQHPLWLECALARLSYPEDFAADARLPGWEPWTVGAGAGILEAWQRPLARRWLELERTKAALASPREMERVGTAQSTVLESFLTALDAAGRHDLARFLLRLAGQLLDDDTDPNRWLGRLDFGGERLRDRRPVYRAALALPRQMETLAGWTARTRQIGYLDDGYAASQLWKADWEECQGDTLVARARAILWEVLPFEGVE